jgi:nucleotide-binding universal stress UspA family protein
MSAFTSILVPLDGSSYAEQALPLAEYLAELTLSKLDVVMIHQPAPLWYVPESGVGFTGFDHAVRRKELVYLERVAGRFTAGTSLPAQSTLLDGDVVRAIDEFVQHHSIDLVVMTTHSRTGLSRLWQGSVADSLVRSLSIPVLVIHPARDASLRPPAIRRILVPLDGSARSASILHRAKHLAKLTSAVIVPAMIVTPARTGAHELRGRRYLDQVQRELEAEGFRTESRLIAGRHVSRSIVKLAADEHCDMIMLSTHGPSVLRRAIRGSVVDEVIRGTTVPVLIQRPTRSADLKARTAAAVESMIAASSGSF